MTFQRLKRGGSGGVERLNNVCGYGQRLSGMSWAERIEVCTSMGRRVRRGGRRGEQGREQCPWRWALRPWAARPWAPLHGAAALLINMSILCVFLS